MLYWWKPRCVDVMGNYLWDENSEFGGDTGEHGLENLIRVKG